MVNERKEVQILDLLPVNSITSLLSFVKWFHEATDPNFPDIRGHLCAIGGNVSWYSKLDGASSKKLKTELPYDPAIPLLGIYPKEF